MLAACCRTHPMDLRRADDTDGLVETMWAAYPGVTDSHQPDELCLCASQVVCSVVFHHHLCLCTNTLSRPSMFLS
jgi:hypothetical protein